MNLNQRLLLPIPGRVQVAETPLVLVDQADRVDVGSRIEIKCIVQLNEANIGIFTSEV